MELLKGIEPLASPLPRECSTTELQQRCEPIGTKGRRWFRGSPACDARTFVPEDGPRAPEGRLGAAGQEPGTQQLAWSARPDVGAGDGNRTHAISLEG